MQPQTIGSKTHDAMRDRRFDYAFGRWIGSSIAASGLRTTVTASYHGFSAVAKIRRLAERLNTLSRRYDLLHAARPPGNGRDITHIAAPPDQLLIYDDIFIDDIRWMPAVQNASSQPNIFLRLTLPQCAGRGSHLFRERTQHSQI